MECRDSIHRLKKGILLNSKLLHQTDEAEKKLLRLVITNEFAMAEAIDTIQAKHIVNGPARLMYRAVQNWFVEGKAVNPLSIKAVIKDDRSMEYFESVLGTSVDMKVADLCEIILNNYKIRTVEAFCQETQGAIHHEPITGDELVDRMQSTALSISEVVSDKELTLFGDEFQATIDEAIAIQKGTSVPNGLPTGISGLDSKLMGGGLRPKQFVVIAGRPGMGKSELALNIAINQCYTLGGRVAFYSLEMSKEELNVRTLTNITEIPAWRFGAGALSDKHLTHIHRLSDRLSKMNLMVSDDPMIRPSQLHARVKRAKLMYPDLNLVVVDYLQLMVAQGGEGNREQEISVISRGLKRMAMDLGIPVIGISQLSRKCESRKGKQPILSDLRESGAIEQDADIVVFCFRPHIYTRDDRHEKIMKLILAKQRNGPTGEIWVTNDVETQRIYQTGKEMFSDNDFDLGNDDGGRYES